MKIKDITIGADYAIERYKGGFYRATVLEAGPISRRVYSGARYDFGGHLTTQAAVRVRYSSGTEDIVPPAKVSSTWEVYEQEAARTAQRKETVEAEYARIESGLAQYGISVQVQRWQDNYGGKGTARIGVDKLSKILELLEAHHG